MDEERESKPIPEPEEDAKVLSSRSQPSKTPRATVAPGPGLRRKATTRLARAGRRRVGASCEAPQRTSPR